MRNFTLRTGENQDLQNNTMCTYTVMFITILSNMLLIIKLKAVLNVYLYNYLCGNLKFVLFGSCRRMLQHVLLIKD